MAISSADKLVVVKAFAPSNPLPLDAREIYDSLADAQAYAKSSAIAYAGQTIKVVDADSKTVIVYTLKPSSTTGTNFDLELVGGGTGSGVQSIGTSSVEGNISVSTANGTSTANKNVPVVGSLVNPVVDTTKHTLTLTKIGATAAQNSTVTVPLGGASPDTIISGVTQGADGLTISITKFDVKTEKSSTETVKIFGAVTGVDASVAGILDMASTNAAGAVVHTKEALVGSVINAAYDSTTKVLTLPVVTGKDASTGAVTTKAVTIDMKGVVAGAFVSVSTTADTTTVSAKHTFTYKDATGASKTTDIYDSGVRKVEAGSTTDKVKVTTANATTGALSSAEFLVGAGSVKNPTYDANTRKITLPILQTDATTKDLVINLGKDMVVKSGSYNTETKNIELVLTDDTKVLISAADLVDIYIGAATTTATTTVSSDNKISVDVKLSTVTNNKVKVDTTNGGLVVLEADFTDTKKLISDGDSATLKSAKDYTDGQISTEVTNRNSAIKKAVDDEVTARNTAISTAISTEVTNRNTYVDNSIKTEVTNRNTAITNALKEAKDYADQQAAAAGTTWVDFGTAS